MSMPAQAGSPPDKPPCCETVTSSYEERVLGYLFFVCLGLFLLVFALRPIADPDFWWHLKTGEVMVEQGGLLQSDPFTFVASADASIREEVILKGYWLWQITVAVFYRLLGFNGIFLMNLVVAAGIVLILIRQFRQGRVKNAIALPLLALGLVVFGAVHFLERPQVLSFLFAALLLGMFSSVRDGGSFGWRLPLLMCLWANVHGGFVVGVLLLLLFGAGVLVQYRQEPRHQAHLLGWIIVGVGASFLNPNGWQPIFLSFGFLDSQFIVKIYEYQSTWWGFHHSSKFVAIVWLLVLAQGVGILLSRKFYWPDLLIITFLCFFAVKYMRNAGFVAIALLPYNGWYLEQASSRIRMNLNRWLLRGLVVGAIILLCWRISAHWQERQNGWPVVGIYPQKVVGFIKTAQMQGRMFNDYAWGGYFLWSLYPQAQVFIDGRGLDPDVFRDYREILKASLDIVEGRQKFIWLLDHYEIDGVVQPLCNEVGRIRPILKFLLVRPDWIPVFLDNDTYVLLKKSEKNLRIINDYQIDKKEFIARIFVLLEEMCRQRPQDSAPQIARAEMMIFAGDYAGAARQLDRLATMHPYHAEILPLRNQLNALQPR